MEHRIQAARQARRLALTYPTAVFSTLSHKMNGHPFGSVSPIALTNEGDVIFYVSDIAQHARNLHHDPRLSVTLFEPALQGDQNEQARLTLSGEAAPMVGEPGQQALARYLKLFPDAVNYTKAHDFKMWGMKVDHIRYIGGFGEIFWLSRDEWVLPSPQWSPEEEVGMVQHMNDDHADACRLLLEHVHGYQASAQPEMLSVYPDGCHLVASRKRYFVPFTQQCLTPVAVRKALAAMTQEARSALA